MESNIFNTGTKFILTENRSGGNQYGVGTTGFVICLEGDDFEFKNICHMDVIVTRRGKTGKDRIEETVLSWPIFNTEANIPSPEKPMNNFVIVEKETINTSISTLSGIDFLGYMVAYTRFIKKLGTKSKYYTRKPGHHLQDGLGNLVNAIAADDEYIKALLGCFPDLERRVAAITTLRKYESGLSNCILSYIKQVGKIEHEALQSLKSKNPWQEYTDDVKNTLTKTRVFEALLHKRIKG